MNSIKDVIKNSFLKEFDLSSVDGIGILISVLLAILFGFFIFLIYSKFFGGVLYSRAFAVTLIGMTLLTCMVTLAISTNVVISLGMVGSLSIIRYRTAVKSPLDLLYMFWAVTVGITVGAHMYILAAVVSLAMFIVIVVFNVKTEVGTLYVAVIHYTGDTAEENIIRAFGRGKYHIKSKTMYKDKVEMAVEVFCRKNKLQEYNGIRDIEGVIDVTFIQYNGEYHG